MNTTQLICDKCKRKIKLKQKHTKVVKVEGDIERMYFKCPHCDTKYTIAYSDSKFRENVNRIQEITAKLRDIDLGDEEVESLVKEQKNLVALNKQISQNYRAIYESKV
jgi:DNA-directed RNA polymerase subunit RPC12/RpoP